ncbi:hypothetical protein D9M68_833520 [compost metagenome]
MSLLTSMVFSAVLKPIALYIKTTVPLARFNLYKPSAFAETLIFEFLTKTEVNGITSPVLSEIFPVSW